MPNPYWMVNIAVPVALRDRIAGRRVHPRQSYHEVIARALDAAESRLPSRRGP